MTDSPNNTGLVTIIVILPPLPQKKQKQKKNILKKAHKQHIIRGCLIRCLEGGGVPIVGKRFSIWNKTYSHIIQAAQFHSH